MYRGYVLILHVGTYARKIHACIVQSAKSRWRRFLSCSQQSHCFECSEHSMLFQSSRHWCGAGGMHYEQQNVYCMQCKHCRQCFVYSRPCTFVIRLAFWAFCHSKFSYGLSKFFQQWWVQASKKTFQVGQDECIAVHKRLLNWPIAMDVGNNAQSHAKQMQWCFRNLAKQVVKSNKCENMRKLFKKQRKKCLKSHTSKDTMSGGSSAPLTLPSEANYIGFWCYFDSILISFNFFFLNQYGN